MHLTLCSNNTVGKVVDALCATPCRCCLLHPSQNGHKLVIALNTAFGSSCIFSYTIQRTAMQAGSELGLRFHPDTHCRDYTVAYWIMSGVHTLFGTVQLALPNYMVLGLQIARQKTAAVATVLLIDGLVCVCPIIRMAWRGTLTSSHEPTCTTRLTFVPRRGVFSD